MDLLTALQVIQTREYLAIYFKSQERNEEENLFGKKINLRVMGSSLMLVGLAKILDAN